MTAASPVASPLLPLPKPPVPISIREATMDDLAFVDRLQKMHTKMVGFMPTAQFEGNIRAGRVLVAEEVSEDVKREDVRLEDVRLEDVKREDVKREDVKREDVKRDNLKLEEVTGAESSHVFTSSRFQQRTPVGYCIASDRYFKRDDVGIIYQMNVLPGRQRSLVGAMLLKAQFERSAYGCKLYCCWCAQDIAANKFWEAMGFVPLAFRTGSAAKSRIHIFWQKRIRRGDETTPWWFPSETSGGAVRENRIVLPIPPGTHWSEAKPLVLPGVPVVSDQLPAIEEKPKRAAKVKKVAEPVVSKNSISLGGLRFWAAAPVVEAKPMKKEPKPKVKNDPKLVAAARELKDRWLEQLNADPRAILPGGKYEVSRSLEGMKAVQRASAAALPGAGELEMIDAMAA